ncbi:hypothetical protein PG985_010440 [Apiospora marii]|uniref:Helicase ATP-binding domain-containing protein n=1 Tax=Apiospora marii TaxID=335849 RepID=A0ABR1RZ94_9PEZI
MAVYNSVDFVVGTSVAFARLVRNKAFSATMNYLMIDEAYRMTEANILSLFATFENTPIRGLFGDMRRLSPVVTTLRTDNNPKSELCFTNPFAMQLAQSMPARMEATGFKPYSLNINLVDSSLDASGNKNDQSSGQDDGTLHLMLEENSGFQKETKKLLGDLQAQIRDEKVAVHLNECRSLAGGMGSGAMMVAVTKNPSIATDNLLGESNLTYAFYHCQDQLANVSPLAILFRSLRDLN